MNPLFAGAAETQEFCRSRDWSFCFVGGMVLMRWSGHRPSKDADILVVCPFGQEQTMIEGFYTRFPPRYADNWQTSPRNRIVQFTTSNGVAVDVALGWSRRLSRIMARASLWDIEGHQLLTSSPEDLIIHKVLSGRPKDWDDIEHIVARQRGTLDIDLIMREFAPVLQQGHHLTDPLAQLQRDDHDQAVARLQGILGIPLPHVA